MFIFNIIVSCGFLFFFLFAFSIALKDHVQPTRRFLVLLSTKANEVGFC